MQQYNIHNVKAHLSTLVEKAANGDAFIIAKNGKPMVKVIPCVSQKKSKTEVELLERQIEAHNDFDNSLKAVRKLLQKEMAKKGTTDAVGDGWEAHAINHYVKS
jgi:prevent-host-death family protein